VHNLPHESSAQSAGGALLQNPEMERKNMKHRTAALLLALCFVSSLSLAESVTDAPLVVRDPYAYDQPEQNEKPVKRHREKKENKKCPPQQAAQSKDKNQYQQAQHQEVSSPAETSPTM
jgi:hypothetical protein